MVTTGLQYAFIHYDLKADMANATGALKGGRKLRSDPSTMQSVMWITFAIHILQSHNSVCVM